MPKYIFVAGGVMSGVGKGVAVASIGKILQSKGFKVTAVKIDPYINVDAGTMNPKEHGEIFVTADGMECDQDIGNYERFLDHDMSSANYMTTGSVYQTVINQERNLDYGGRCVEVVPDIPNEVIKRIRRAAYSQLRWDGSSESKIRNRVKKSKCDFILVEIGGTVGEYQNMLFLEAARMLKLSHPKDVLFILVSYLPIPKTIGEMKTKPTQYAVRTLNSAGIQPDIILARSKAPLDEPRKKKISTFCNVLPEDVISAPDVDFIYEIPINFEKDNLGTRILKKFDKRPRKKIDLEDWKKLIKTIKGAKKQVKIGIVGKYFETGDFTLMDSYISVIEAVKHACWFFKKKPEICWLSAHKYEKNNTALKELNDYDGIIIPGGFGSSGIEGKIKAISYCRKQKIPFLGLCLGMQLAVIEFARNKCGLSGACSAEFRKSRYQVIDVMPEQKGLISDKKYGGTMRLGDYLCEIKPQTAVFRAYGYLYTTERHRHRYELNNAFREVLEAKGMIMAGRNPEKNLIEIIEIPDHPFFIGCQFHPEFKSRPLKPHPLFREFIRACIKKRS